MGKEIRDIHAQTEAVDARLDEWEILTTAAGRVRYGDLAGPVSY